MFREMRRKKQLLSHADTIDILNAGTAGVLGVWGDDGYPYTVPLSYVLAGDTLYFHCAKKGHKLDAIERNDKVSFCVIDKDDVIQKAFTTHFRSAIVFGTARIVMDDDERRRALECLAAKYSPDYLQDGSREIDREWNRVAVIAVKIEHMTGKAAIELVDQPE